MVGHATILWQRLDLPGHDAATLRQTLRGWQLDGVAVLAHDGRPCVLTYSIDCDKAWVTQRAMITGHVGGVPVALDLARTPADEWSVSGAPIPTVAGCKDVDLAFTPATNLLPIRRLDLAVGASAQVRATWVRFPELTLEILEQVYTHSGPGTYHYESNGGAFQRDLTVDEETGFVLDYAGLWRAEARRARPVG